MKARTLSIAVLASGLFVGYTPALAGTDVPASPATISDEKSSAPAASSFSTYSSSAAASSSSSASPSKAVVDDDLLDCPDAAFTTIQGAVDSGAKDIDVCAGTYPENVVIGAAAHDLKLKGAGVGATLVTGVAGTAGPIIDVSGGRKTTIEDMTVDGSAAMAGGVVYGIRYTESDGKIKDVEVLNIRNGSGSSQGIGIRVDSTGAQTKVKVEESVVDNYTRVGINGNGPGVEIEVKDSDISGPLPPTVWAPNGIQVSRGAEGKITKNTVDNNPSPNVPGGAGSGIILFCSGDTEVKDNTVTRADIGISVVDTAMARVERNDVLDSDFDGISLQFLGLFFGDIGCTAPGAPLPVENNRIYRNTIDNSGDTGISLANFDEATLATTPNNNDIEKNDVSNSANDGIHVFVFGSENPSDNLFDKNEIETSGGTDAVDDTTGAGTAGTANTWDKNECATSSPAGLCD